MQNRQYRSATYDEPDRTCASHRHNSSNRTNDVPQWLVYKITPNYPTGSQSTLLYRSTDRVSSMFQKLSEREDIRGYKSAD